MKSKKVSYLKNFSLLFKCILSSLSFGATWAGLLIYHKYSFGLWLIIGGSLISLYSLISSFILPLRRLK